MVALGGVRNQDVENLSLQSVTSLSAKLNQHPNYVKSSNQLKYIIVVQSHPQTASKNELDTTVRLTADKSFLQSHIPIESYHGYLSDLPPEIPARNANCAQLAPRSNFHPLISSEYATRDHLIRKQERCADTSQINLLVKSENSENKCISTSKNRDIKELLASMKSAPRKSESQEMSKTSKMQNREDHDYCLTRTPLAKALQKQNSKLEKVKNPAALEQVARATVKQEDPLPGTSKSKRLWIDSSSSDDEAETVKLEKKTVEPASKRGCPSPKQDSSLAGNDTLERVNTKQSKVVSKKPAARSTTKKSARTSAKKAPSKKQGKQILLNFAKKPSK